MCKNIKKNTNVRLKSFLFKVFCMTKNCARSVTNKTVVEFMDRVFRSTAQNYQYLLFVLENIRVNTRTNELYNNLFLRLTYVFFFSCKLLKIKSGFSYSSVNFELE